VANRVRSHTRKKPGGGTTRVQQHSRASRPRKGLVSAGHAWGLVKRAYRANKRKKKLLAFTLLGLGVAEGTAWLTLDTAGRLLVTAAVLATLFGGLLLTATGRE
jgi:hypothetical protein